MGSLIFIDTSVFVAILACEPYRARFESEIETAERRMTSSVVRLETAMVLASRLVISLGAAQGQFDKFLGRANVEQIAIDAAVARGAVECFEKLGRGRHPARLNFADCLSYASAKALGARLVLKGGDFAESDVNSWI